MSNQIERMNDAIERLRSLLATCEILAIESDDAINRRRADQARDNINAARSILRQMREREHDIKVNGMCPAIRPANGEPCVAHSDDCLQNNYHISDDGNTWADPVQAARVEEKFGG